jgi:hypothetical protein
MEFVSWCGRVGLDFDTCINRGVDVANANALHRQGNAALDTHIAETKKVEKRFMEKFKPPPKFSKRGSLSELFQRQAKGYEANVVWYSLYDASHFLLALFLSLSFVQCANCQ